MSKLIIKQSNNNKKVIITPDAAYWALRIRFLYPEANIRYENTGNNCAGFWPLSFKKVGIQGAKNA